MSLLLNNAISGLLTAHRGMDTTSHNIANVNTTRPADEEPFRAKLVHAEESLDGAGRGKGTQAVGILESQADPMWVYDPEHPHASEEGYVVRPVVELSKEMADMIAAQRSYQLNLQVIRTNEETYQAALRIGR